MLTIVMNLWVLCAWIACAVFSGHIAGEKNRCGLCWFVWGVLFGPIALVAVVGLPETRKAEDLAVLGKKQEFLEKLYEKPGRYMLALLILMILFMSFIVGL